MGPLLLLKAMLDQMLRREEHLFPSSEQELSLVKTDGERCCFFPFVLIAPGQPIPQSQAEGVSVVLPLHQGDKDGD